MHFLQAINSDISVLIVCNKNGGTIKGDILKKLLVTFFAYIYITVMITLSIASILDPPLPSIL